MRILGVILLVLGILAIVYGGFWVTREEKVAEIGPVEVQVEKKEPVNIPLWAGVAVTAAGVLLILGNRRGV
jgi:plastocyanin domain-containing protein